MQSRRAVNRAGIHISAPIEQDIKLAEIAMLGADA
jgi:hypothetical protein